MLFVDHYMYEVICRSLDGLSVNEKSGKTASNDNSEYRVMFMAWKRSFSGFVSYIAFANKV